jgi:acetylornithine deacetylase/succinyl-diaminopimelate desuccinylase-like protein
MKRLIALALLVGGLPALEARAVDFDGAADSARGLLGELVAADTSNPPGNEARAVAIGAARLDAAGIAHRITQFAPGRENLVARLRGDGSAPPLLLLAHVDVVGAEGQAWSTDPHRMVAADGYLTGRGVADDLGMAAVVLVVLELLKREGVLLARDVIVAWTGDEESGGGGIRWLLEHEPQQIEAAIVINEGGGIRLGEDGTPSRIELQTAEKIYQDFKLVARGTTGHSSVPLPDNAIQQLARRLTRLGDHRFPPRLLPVTRAYFSARAPLESGERRRAMEALVEARGAPPAEALAVLDADPLLAASLRTTCVATMLSGGTRVNALPAEARANINCRILPDRSAESLHAELIEIIDDPGIEVTPTREFGHGVPSPLDGPGPEAIRALAEAMWPGIPVIPFMSRGATDSRFARAHGMAAYGISPIAIATSDARRAHGIDERIPAASLRPAVEFLYRLVVALAARDGGS